MTEHQERIFGMIEEATRQLEGARKRARTANLELRKAEDHHASLLKDWQECLYPTAEKSKINS